MSWEGVKLNIVDTPGHADFGGEVERVMSIVDGETSSTKTPFLPEKRVCLVWSDMRQKGLKGLRCEIYGVIVVTDDATL